MALAAEKRRRIALLIIKIVHDCPADMRAIVSAYRNSIIVKKSLESRLTKSASTEEIVTLNAAIDNAKSKIRSDIIAAVGRPYAVSARVQAAISLHGAQVIRDSLASVSPITVVEIMAELNALKSYTDVLRGHYRNDGWTLEQLANDIDTSLAPVDSDEQLPLPVDYSESL